METILVTGGAGYIGSHTLVSLYESGYQAVVVDDLSNSNIESVKRVNSLVGQEIPTYIGDVKDKDFLTSVFQKHHIDAIIHFAGFKAVGESVSMPIEYYQNNLNTTLTLLEVMREFNCKRFIFSSSATVYGINNKSPLTEDLATSATNPYGWSKVFIEHILNTVVVADPDFSAVLLRYFNPIGAHESGIIGEDPKGIPNNLMPYVTQVAVGKRDKLNVFGNDYATHDGTGVRDYIHVVDLANGHVKALEFSKNNKGSTPINLGTGTGYSVLDLVKAFEKSTGVKIPYEIAPRRAGDIDEMYADPSRARSELNWEAKYDLEKMCEDSWRWQKNNPDGYKDVIA